MFAYGKGMMPLPFNLFIHIKHTEIRQRTILTEILHFHQQNTSRMRFFPVQKSDNYEKIIQTQRI
mgnify:CR=1 FL=1